jgi:hypothetical protein
MSAVYFHTIGDMVDNLIFLSLTNEVGALVADWLQTWKDENPDYLDLELSQDDINAMLKALTGCVVGTDTDLACYPLGIDTAILFDLSGDRVD